MGRGRAWLAAASVCAVAGCSLTTDLTGFSNGPTSGGGGDGGTADGAPASDSSTLVDGAPLGDGAPAPVCAGTHFFCTDFDKLALSDEWNTVSPGDGTIDRNMAASVSKPYSLLVTHPVGNPTTPPTLVRTVAANVALGGLHCSFDYRREAVDPDGVLVALAIDFNTSVTDHLFVEIKDGKLDGRVYLAAVQPDGGTLDDFPTIPTFSTPALGDWAKVDWTIDLRARRSTLKSDAKLIDQRDIPPFDPGKTVSVKFALGLANHIAPSSPWQVRYDDFVCDALP